MKKETNEYQLNCASCSSVKSQLICIVENPKETFLKFLCVECGTLSTATFTDRKLQGKPTQLKRESSMIS